MSENNNRYVFITKIPVDGEVYENKDNRDGIISAIVDKAFEFSESVRTRLGTDDPCYFLLHSNGNFKSAVLLFQKSKSIETCKKEVYDFLKKANDSDLGLDDETICISFITNDAIHWDYNFLKLSEHFPEYITIFGYHPSCDDFARQIYAEGDFDTGVEADPEAADAYVGEDMLISAGLSKDMFSLKKYA